MKRFWLVALLIFATVARADSVDSFTWSPLLRQFQAVTHSNGTKPLASPGGAAPASTCPVSANYTFTDTDGCAVLLVTTGSSTISVTLPAALSNIGRVLAVKKVDSGTGKIQVNRAGSDTIDGTSQLPILMQYGNLILHTLSSSTWGIEALIDGGTFTAAFNTGMSTATTNVTVTWRRTSLRNVTMELPASSASATATTSSWSTSGTPVPSEIRPTNSLRPIIMTINNGSTDASSGTAALFGFAVIATNGSLEVDRYANWTNGTANCGFQAINFAYTL